MIYSRTLKHAARVAFASGSLAERVVERAGLSWEKLICVATDGEVNTIRSRALNHRQFVSPLEAVGSEHGDILYHTEVRWLSRGKVPKRFFDLKQKIDTSLKTKNRAVTEQPDAK